MDRHRDAVKLDQMGSSNDASTTPILLPLPLPLQPGIGPWGEWLVPVGGLCKRAVSGCRLRRKPRLLLFAHTDQTFINELRSKALPFLLSLPHMSNSFARFHAPSVSESSTAVPLSKYIFNQDFTHWGFLCSLHKDKTP